MYLFSLLFLLGNYINLTFKIYDISCVSTLFRKGVHVNNRGGTHLKFILKI